MTPEMAPTGLSAPSSNTSGSSTMTIPSVEAPGREIGWLKSDLLPNKDTHTEEASVPEKAEGEAVEPGPAPAPLAIVPVPQATVPTPAIVPAEAVVRKAGKDDFNTKGMEQLPTEAVDRKEFIQLTHPRDVSSFRSFSSSRPKSYILPWSLCQTWKGMEKLIKQSYRGNENAIKQIDEGSYNVLFDNGIVEPAFWEMLAKPGWAVSIQLNSTESESRPDLPVGDEDKSKLKPDLPVTYAVKIKYTVDYHRKEHGGRGDFLSSFSSNEHPVLETVASKTGGVRSVLEVKTSVTLGSDSTRNNSLMQDMKSSKNPPKIDSQDQISETRLHIHSPLLLNVLRAIIKYSSAAPTGDRIDQLTQGVFTHPFHDLFHYRNELVAYKDNTADGPRTNHTAEYNEECDQHIDLLLQYLKDEPAVKVLAQEAMWVNELEAPGTTFAAFWLLMKPGSDVYVHEGGQLNAYVVDKVAGGIRYGFQGLQPVQASSYKVTVWNLVFDGKTIRRKSKTVGVPVFDDKREIRSLPLFPTRFQDKLDGGKRRQQLIERGEKGFKFAKGPTFLEYTGAGLRPGWRRYDRARVVVEHESRPWESKEFELLHDWKFSVSEKDDHNEKSLLGRMSRLSEKDGLGNGARSPRCECSHCTNHDAGRGKYTPVTFSNYDSISPREMEALSDHQYLVYTSHVYAFVLKDRAYDLLDVGGLSNPKLVEDAIDQLVMRPESNKNTIKAIAKTYADSGQSELFRADFIHGKGEGQIFLLHGPPGTGKTLTAESVAEYTRRPLLSITAADLGHDPAELEKNLLRFFKDANNWDAIVLLDEADVYLEQRSVSDLRRNSIVSIFLRALDYFQGILFLTTNRVGRFDEAFMSRIHVSIGYQPLDQDARDQIWDNLFRKLRDDHIKNGAPKIGYEYDAKEYVKRNPDVRDLNWNGREIRNAFQTAVALATFDSNEARQKGKQSIPEVKEKHLKQIVKMYAEFKKYMVATHNDISDVDRAFTHGNRDDKFFGSKVTDDK
ncbi:hypothetical protein B0T25DRAFT_550200 [Lasiosphaeria hispida]|uniref:AAA+ ATPase domain-containing protein n=1 Tax=Lasiosphaeria hispida TaxID=260671 RepID=A0AAJ0HGP9_9PEZI|nr:hypothetical protein B0T25DRAFT_550200 [Lasiosphaeria hispida]